MGHAPTLKSGLDGIVWPAVPAGDAATIAALVAGLQTSERLPLAEIEAAQGAQLARLAAHHGRHSPAFRARLAAAGLAAGALDSVARLRELPPLSRQQLQAAGKDFFAAQVPRGHEPVGEVTTSGSTGEPVKMKKTGVGRLFWAACTIRDHLWHGRDFAGRMTSIRPTNPPYVEMEDWGFPVAELFATGKAQAMPGTMGIDEQVAAIDRFQPQHLLCFPEQPQGARRSLGGAARRAAGEHSPRSHRRRDAFGRPARPSGAHARPADRGQLLLAGGRHHRLAVPGGRALSHDGRVAGRRGARRARAGPVPRARSAGWS